MGEQHVLNSYSLERVDLSDTKVKDVSGLRDIPGLVFENTDAYFGMRRLEEHGDKTDALTVTGPDIDMDELKEDLRKFGRAHYLRKLVLSGTTITTIPAVTPALTRLEWLNIDGCMGLERLDGIEDFTGLTRLDASLTPVSDMDIVKGCVSMKEINMSCCEKLEKIDAIAACIRIEVLRLVNTPVEDVSALQHCTALRVLDLLGTCVKSVSTLDKCTALEDLNLIRTNVSEIRSLRECTALTELHLGGTRVADIGPLAECTALTKLNLINTRVMKLSPLRSCKALKEVRVGGLSILDVKAVINAIPGLELLDD